MLEFQKSPTGMPLESYIWEIGEQQIPTNYTALLHTLEHFPLTAMLSHIA